MKDLFECGACGVVTEASEHLCDPRAVSGKSDYCGTTTENADICATMAASLDYQCGTCGRPAESSGLVCNPVKIS